MDRHACHTHCPHHHHVVSAQGRKSLSVRPRLLLHLVVAMRRRERRLRAAWRHEQLSVRMALAAAQHHSTPGGRKGPTGTRSTKDGVCGPAEELRPVSEVEAGVNFRPAGSVRGQVAGSLPGRQPGTGTRRVRESAVTHSLHPEVPDTQYVSPGRGLGIRQSMGWTKVCQTAQSGIWGPRGTYETGWDTPRHDCLCPYEYGHGAVVRPQTNNVIWDGVISLWCRVALLLSPLCARRNMPTECELEPVRWSKIMHLLA